MATVAGLEQLEKALQYETLGIAAITNGDKAACGRLKKDGLLEERGGRLFITEAGKRELELSEKRGKPVRAVRGRVQDEESEPWAAWRPRG